MFKFDYNTEEKVITVTFTGRMDYLAVTDLLPIIESESILQNRDPEARIIFDVGGVEYIASSFIRLCLSYAKLAGPGKFSITNCQPFVKKTFKISGLDELLHIS